MCSLVLFQKESGRAVNTLSLLGAANSLCLYQLMKPQATVTLNLVSKDGRGGAAAEPSLPATAEKGKRFSHRVGTFGANSDPSMAPPGLAAYCTVRAFCNLFRGIVTLFSWHCHVRVCSFGGFGGRGRPALSGFILSFEFTSAEQSAISPVSMRASPSMLETVIFQLSIYIRTFKHSIYEMEYASVIYHPLDIKNQVMIFS